MTVVNIRAKKRSCNQVLIRVKNYSVIGCHCLSWSSMRECRLSKGEIPGGLFFMGIDFIARYRGVRSLTLMARNSLDCSITRVKLWTLVQDFPLVLRFVIPAKATIQWVLPAMTPCFNRDDDCRSFLFLTGLIKGPFVPIDPIHFESPVFYIYWEAIMSNVEQGVWWKQEGSLHY